jgi:hypothetical protein
MPSPQDSFVQVAADGSGKRVRNMALQVVLPDNTIGTVYMQVVSIADENGNEIIVADELDWRQQMLDETRAIRIAMQQMWDAGNERLPMKSRDDFLELALEERNPVLE